MSRSWWVLGLLPSLAVAQVDSAVVQTAHWSHRLTITSEAGYDSNVLDNALVWGLVQGENLSRDTRLHGLEALGSNNRLGLAVQGTATLTWQDNLFGWENWMPRISLSHRDLLGIRFTKDAYDLTFFGNAPFEDRVANLGPSAFEQVTFQTLAFGMEHRTTGTFLEAGVVNGMHLNTGKLNQADLYTAPDGRFLNLELDGHYERSDTAENQLSKGLGLVINLQWSHRFHGLGGVQKLTCSATDVGFVVWGPRSLSASKDSSIHFEGMRVENIMDLEGLILDEHRLQDSLGLGYSPGGTTKLLPARFAAELQFGPLLTLRSARQQQAFVVSVDQLVLPGHLPHASLRWNTALFHVLMATVGVSNGGSGGLRAQTGLEAAIGQHLQLGVALPNVIGLFSDQANGKALAGRLEVCW
ncbi:MAG: hypothetical protein KBH07_02405 [Flavobacteriales bacterium]|nr:hypothetical protein [Flavobacteriales bacterium]MBP9079646.1 hypothetical protein [Flavobacteriales bacterium]